MNTIFNLPLEIDLKIRSHLTDDELIATMTVSKRWYELNQTPSLWIDLLKIYFSFVPNNDFSLIHQFGFLRTISRIGQFPIELLKLIGEYYQFQKLHIFGEGVSLWGIRNQLKFVNGFPNPWEIKFPIMVANDEKYHPYVIFKICERVSKTVEESGAESVLVCAYSSHERWELKHKYKCPVIKKLELTKDKGTIFYEDNIEIINKLVTKKLEKVELVSQ